MFASLARFGPLVSVSDKLAGELSPSELDDVAAALAGDGAEAFAPLLEILAKAEPTVKVADLLGSPTAQRLFRSVEEAWLLA